MFISILLAIIGLGLIILGAHILVDGSSSLAKKYNVSNIVIGLTVVAFGTSTPEMVVSIYAAITKNADIAIGNAIGSNIFNIFGILGISALIFPLTVLGNTVFKEIPMSLLAAVVLTILLNDIFFQNGSADILSRSESIVFLLFFAIFLYYIFHLIKNSKDDEQLNIKIMSKLKSILWIGAGIIGLVIGGKLFVDQIMNMALSFGISQSILGLTVVAVGTSLPELATSVVAAYKKNSDIAVGNVVGSNIFNIFFILGVSGTIYPLPIGNITNIDLFVCCGASILLYFFSLYMGKLKIGRAEGLFLLICYFLYLGFQISQLDN